MNSAVTISSINDFIFCPKSLFLHLIYTSFHKDTYHDEPQIQGTIAHLTIDTKRYSTEKRFLIALPIYSRKYNLIGKIDIYDKKNKMLIERKYKVNKIYDGHKLQLWAQYICMTEMKYEIKQLKIYSMIDNKSYPIELPTQKDIQTLAKIVKEIQKCKPATLKLYRISPAKCRKCIYKILCDQNEE